MRDRQTETPREKDIQRDRDTETEGERERERDRDKTVRYRKSERKQEGNLHEVPTSNVILNQAGHGVYNPPHLTVYY